MRYRIPFPGSNEFFLNRYGNHFRFTTFDTHFLVTGTHACKKSGENIVSRILVLAT
jgi:hypothetical protein